MFPEGSYLTHEIIEDFVKKGIWNNIDLYSLLEDTASKKPDQVAIVTYKEQSGDRTEVTYGELLEKVNNTAAAFTKLGVKSGDVVSVQLPNWWEFAVVSFATLKIGAVINGLTPIYRQKEVSYILKMTESKVVVIPDIYRNFNYLDMFMELKPSLPALEKIIVVTDLLEDNDEEDDIINFRKILNFKSDKVIQPSNTTLHSNQLAQLAFTSGTTGEPKGVMHTHNTIEATVRSFVNHMDLSKGVKNLVVSPVGHQTGFLWGTLMTVMLEGTIVYLDTWNAERALNIMHKDQISTMVAAYPFLHDVAKLNDIETRRPETLKLVCIPGAPIPRHMVSVCAKNLNCVVAPAWGMTEYGIALAVSPSDPESGFVTDGRQVNGAQVRIIDENDLAVPAGVEGNLQIKGGGLFIGYYKRPEKTAESFQGDMWFDTGDRATADEKGFIAITGRTKDIIIRGGENIPISEIENLLFKWEKVSDVAIVAMPDERLGERACAYIVPNSGKVTFEEMVHYLLAHGIAKQKLPERLELTDELPRTASGKVQKFVLRNNIKEKLAQSNPVQ
ncbi:AMP-binding protein [Neobacillus sp. YX16]|uniref:AMP-binding protein n=1 Tax=Neobacillus sp. YX16 TaxID=3047874 RepID=UPI0024C468B9|nr:AMP-binding protein [Neobacillus sp. YX16]WHZ00882.1 AMP-binding protein [Neobacillus sp. YX16]